jgi:hypothetical protein
MRATEAHLTAHEGEGSPLVNGGGVGEGQHMSQLPSSRHRPLQGWEAHLQAHLPGDPAAAVVILNVVLDATMGAAQKVAQWPLVALEGGIGANGEGACGGSPRLVVVVLVLLLVLMLLLVLVVLLLPPVAWTALMAPWW